MIEFSDVVVLEEAADDMNVGRAFYERQETGVGDYFWDCILSDIESLIIYAGVHQQYFDSYRMLSKRFPYAIYYEIRTTLVYVTAVLPLRVDPAKNKAKMQDRH
ncbi:MAG: hypothetical protein ACI8WB_002427 [Phenylobacterium sp.]|jgi:hypothetical protein